MQDNELDRLLARAAANPPEPSPGLMERVLSDALALQPQPHLSGPAVRQTRQGLLERLSGLFGGTPGLAGVMAAAVLGITVGYFNPETVDALANGLGDSGTEEFFPSIDFMTAEG